MDPNSTVETLMAQLGRIREMYGEEKFKYAAKQAARMLIAQGPEMRAKVQEVLKDVVDLDEVEREPPPPFPGAPSNEVMMHALRQQMPGIQTQAQLNATLTAFDALKVTLNAIFLGNKDGVEEGKQALSKAIETASLATDISAKLGHVPEAATSAAADEFKKPPMQFHEYDTMKSLLVELNGIETVEQLTQWYQVTRSRIDQVVTQSYRNELLDSIRHKKTALQNAARSAS